MKDHSVILFDLDGTLTDSAEGILNCVKCALSQMGVEIPPQERLLKFVGPPLDWSFSNICGLDAEKTQQAVKLYRERYSTVGLFENSVYDGVPQMLARLKASGKRLAVCTSKPKAFAVRIIEKFGLAGFFEYVGGSGLDGSLNTKTEVIKHTLETIGVSDRDSVLMVGDRHHDIEGAAALGIKTLAVLYGYGSREEFERFGAAYIAKTPQQAADMILGCDNTSLR